MSALLRSNCLPGRYVELFAEEVVRGGPAFALSLVLSAVEPTLRAAAELGAWQLISPVDALGRIVVVAGLHEVQDTVRWRRCWCSFWMLWWHMCHGHCDESGEGRWNVEQAVAGRRAPMLITCFQAGLDHS